MGPSLHLTRPMRPTVSATDDLEEGDTANPMDTGDFDTGSETEICIRQSLIQPLKMTCLNPMNHSIQNIKSFMKR